MRRVGLAAALLSASTLASRILGQLREMALAWQFGASAQTDAYNAAFWLPDLLSYFLAGGALSIAFMPGFSKALHEGREDDGWRLFSNIANITAVVLVAAIGVAWLAAPSIVSVMFAGFSAEQLATTTSLTRIILPGPIFFFVGGLLTATENARGRFLAAALSPLVYNVCIILGGLLLGPSFGVAGFSWGVLLGSCLGPFLIPLLFARRSIRYSLAFSPRDPSVRAYYLTALPLMLGVSLLTVDEWLLRHFGAALEPGTITHLNNARKLMLVPGGLIGQAVAQALLPFLTRDVAAGRDDLAHQSLVKAVRGTAVLATMAAVALVALAQPAVSLVYQHGAFVAADADITASYLVAFAAALPSWCAASVISRGFYARSEMALPMKLSTLVTLASYPVYALAVHLGGGSGLACATAVGYLLHAMTLGGAFDRRHQVGVVRAYAVGVAEGAAAGTLGALPAWWLVTHSAVASLPNGLMGNLVRCLVGGAIIAVVCLVWLE
jgi:putative peptidoglycan lipid II flippase